MSSSDRRRQLPSTDRAFDFAPLLDLNADLGEATDAAGTRREAELLTLATSASIACGGHAGDARSMERLAGAASKRGVAIGAHPSYPDFAGFGRRELGLEADAIALAATAQIEALRSAARAARTRVRYVKPHGALYHRLAADEEAALAFVAAVAAIDPTLAILGPPDSALLAAAARQGLSAAREGFLDRGDPAGGALAPRALPGALVDSPEAVAERALAFAFRRPIATLDGGELRLDVDSLCVHGDSPGAIDLLRAARAALVAAGVEIRGFAA